MPRRQTSRKRKNGGGNTCTGAKKKTLAQLMEEEAAAAKQELDEIKTALKVLNHFEYGTSITEEEITTYNSVLDKINSNFKDGIDGKSDLTKLYSSNKTTTFVSLCNKFRTSLLSYLKEMFLRILSFPNNKKYKLSESELKCITEEEKKKITERSLLLKSQKELTESEKVERENAVKRRLDEQRAFIIKSDYDETVLHLCTFKSPTLSADMSEQDVAYCAFTMRNGVNLKNYSKRFVIPSYKEWVQIVKDANIEKPNFKQWLLDQNKITAFDANFMEKIENITREYNSNPTKLRYPRAPTMEEWIKINEAAERSKTPAPILDDEWLIKNNIRGYKNANPTPGDKTIAKTFGKTRRRTKTPQ
jgi:hypothetical protein